VAHSRASTPAAGSLHAAEGCRESSCKSPDVCQDYYDES
jgi:hypothetical protein